MSGEGPVTKKQHYVPKFYLRPFLNENGVVEILDVGHRKFLTPKGVKGICYEHYFYGIETGQLDEVSQEIEAAFQQTEDKLAKDLNLIIPKILNNEQILHTEKWTVAFLMSMLWMRGPAMRQRINGMSETVLKQMNAIQFGSQFADRMFDSFDKDTGNVTTSEMRAQIRAMMVGKNYDVAFNNQLHLAIFEDMHRFANLFFAQHWTVYISKLPQKFITSDSPVAVTFPKRKSFYGPTFLERIHYFPLTPEICIMAGFPHVESGKKFHRKTLLRGQEVRLLDLNVTISNHAHQFAYATEKKSLEEILATVKKLEQFVSTPQGKQIQKMFEEGQDLTKGAGRAAAIKTLLNSETKPNNLL